MAGVGLSADGHVSLLGGRAHPGHWRPSEAVMQ